MNKPEEPSKLKRYMCAFLVVFLLLGAVAADPPDQKIIDDADAQLMEVEQFVAMSKDPNIGSAKAKADATLAIYKNAGQSADPQQLIQDLADLDKAFKAVLDTPNGKCFQASMWLSRQTNSQSPLVGSPLFKAYEKAIDDAKRKLSTPGKDLDDAMGALAKAKAGIDEAETYFKQINDASAEQAEKDEALESFKRYLGKVDSFTKGKLEGAIDRLNAGRLGKAHIFMKEKPYGYAMLGGLITGLGLGATGGVLGHKYFGKSEPVNPTPTQNTSEETSQKSDTGKFWLYVFVTVALVAIMAGVVWFFYYREQTNSGSSKASDGGEKGDKSEGSKKASSATGGSSTGATGSNTSAAATGAGSSSAKVSGTASSGKPQGSGTGQATKTSS